MPVLAGGEHIRSAAVTRPTFFGCFAWTDQDESKDRIIAVNDNQGFPPVEPIAAGLKGRCPRCGKGRLLGGFLSLASACENCGLDFAFADAVQRRAVPVMLLVGLVVAATALWLQLSYSPPPWVHLLWVPPVAAICLPALRLVKGVLVTLHYANGAAGEQAAGEQPGR